MRRALLAALLLAAAPVSALSARSRFIKDYLARYRTSAPPADSRDLAHVVSRAALDQRAVPTVYDPSYVKLSYPGGDVPAGRGVCTDVVIRALRKVGVDLQKDVHEDMAAAFAAYPRLYGRDAPDASIDHRRVPNLMVFFARHGAVLPLSARPKDYRPGEIVAWDLGGGVTHVGVVTSDMNQPDGRYMVVHNIGEGPKEEDVLFSWRIIGHYRYLPGDRR